MTPEAIIEAVARVIYEAHRSRLLSWGHLLPCDRQPWQASAQAAIEATLLAVREATPEMQDAGGLAINEDADVLSVTGHEAMQAFTAMIDTRLAQLKGSTNVG